MTSVTIGDEGEIALPEELRERYGLDPETEVRVIETRSGILLVPLAKEPMSPELAVELTEWQAFGLECWDQFPYQETEM